MRKGCASAIILTDEGRTALEKTAFHAKQCAFPNLLKTFFVEFYLQKGTSNESICLTVEGIPICLECLLTNKTSTEKGMVTCTSDIDTFLLAATKKCQNEFSSIGFISPE